MKTVSAAYMPPVAESVEWETPQAFFDKLDVEFRFSLDPCASPENAKCVRFFTKEIDGLAQDWGGATVFCNPPYGPALKEWVAKCADASEKGATVVMLIPSRTDTRWWHQHIEGKAEVRFVKGRLKFGGCENSAPFPSAVVVLRPSSLCRGIAA